MSDLVLASEPSSLVAVNDQCAELEMWAEQCDSIPMLQDATNKLAAIDEYLARTSTEGRGRVAAAMRRLEVRIGQLLPPRGDGQGTRTDIEPRNRDPEVPLDRHQRADFRRMAENEEVVEDVIATSTDNNPASRRSVTNRIKDATKNNPAEANREPPRNLPLAERTEQIRILARRNFTSPQIADELGISPHRVRDIARSTDIDITADAVFGGKFRTVDSNRIMSAVIDSALPESISLARVAYSELDRDLIEGWVSSLSDAIRSLTTIKRNLQKELTRDQS